MKSKINRNDPCHCDSGKKYKNCHENSESKNTSKFPLIFGVILVIAIGLFLIKPNQNQKSGAGKPGQVWSEEHGHWHDAPTNKAPLPAAPIETTEPKGETPAGKVWSEEHGHWHDAPSTQSTSATPTGEKSTKPPGPAPEGKVWSEEHGHWHEAKATQEQQSQ